MRLYNTFSRKVEEFKPIEAKKVKLFVCGPTVYDYIHIGNAKTYIQLDILVRFLRQLGYDVFYLQNITDIDDKIIARSQEQDLEWQKLSSNYLAAYMEDIKRMGINSVTQYAKATDHIDDIIKQVEALMAKGHAYKIDNGIYFEVATFKDYGKLSGRQEVKQDDAQSRIDQSDKKRGWNDFCLWKFSKPDEPVWEAPFGKGRPGWHIEDTAITEHFFGPQYDVHGGAVDLIFPHHEAEIAQIESASGKQPMVNYWVHVGFLNVNKSKMSKSLGNFHTVRDVLAKQYDPVVIRTLMAQAHYRSPLDFSWELLDAAKARWQTLQAMADLRHQATDSGVTEDQISQTKQQMQADLEDDLNTPKAWASLSQLEAILANRGVNEAALNGFKQFLDWLDAIFGLDLTKSADISPEQKKLIAERQAARQNKDWTKSDQLRDDLKQQGIELKDTDNGQLWNRLYS